MKRNYVPIILVTLLFAGICFSVSAQDSGWEQRTGYKYQKLLIKDLVCLHLSPNSDTIYTYNKDGFLRIWDFESGMLIDSVNFIDTVSKFPPNLFHFSSDGKTAVISYYGIDTLRRADSSILYTQFNSIRQKINVYDFGAKSIIAKANKNMLDWFFIKNRSATLLNYSVNYNYIKEIHKLFVKSYLQTFYIGSTGYPTYTSGYLGIVEIVNDSLVKIEQLDSIGIYDYLNYNDSLTLYCTNSAYDFQSVKYMQSYFSTSYSLVKHNLVTNHKTNLVSSNSSSGISKVPDYIKITRVFPSNMKDIILYKSNSKYFYYDLASNAIIQNLFILFPHSYNRIIEAVYDSKDVLVMYQDSVFYFNNIKHLFRIDSIVSPIYVDSFFVVKNNKSLIAYNSKGEIVVLPIGTITSVPENNTITTNTITLYPNPTSETLTVIGPEDATSIKIINSLGMEVASQLMRDSQADINVHTWPSGVYFLQLTSPKGISTKKIEVIH